MESNLFAITFSQVGVFADGALGPGGVFRLPVDATLVGVSFYADGPVQALLRLSVDIGDETILEKTVAINGPAAILFGRGDFGGTSGLPPLRAWRQHPHITKDHSLVLSTGVTSGTANGITVVLYFLAG